MCKRPSPLLNPPPHTVTHLIIKTKKVLRAIRAALKPDGLFLICDIKGLPGGAAANIASHPMAPLMYGYSVACCLGSGLSAPGGLGLGTLGFDREVCVWCVCIWRGLMWGSGWRRAAPLLFDVEASARR